MEHIFATSAIIQNAVHNGLPLSVTFLDLKNAFGSVPHQLIKGMLTHIKVPMEVRSYVSSAYSQLTARVVTKNWTTPSFAIERGVFQGDTLSPLIFLIAFNPIIQLAQSLSTCGFRLKVSDPTSHKLPEVNSHLYVQWDEKDSDEPQGWYLAKITSVESDGTATVLYRKGKTLETFNLSEVNWFSAPGNGKWYLSRLPSTLDTKCSKPHKVKGFADDLSVFSSSMKDHEVALQSIDNCCSNLNLTLKPSKCVSFVYDGKKVLNNATFLLGNGSSRNISSGPTKFLGHTLCHNPTTTAKQSGRRFMNSFLEKLDNLDTSPIRREYKLWILRRFLVPSFHFVLAVDVIPESCIKKVQSQCAKRIKVWLGLTKGVTNAVIHHPNVIDIPTISEYRTKAKLTLLSSILTSKDPMITEISELLLDQDFATSQR